MVACATYFVLAFFLLLEGLHQIPLSSSRRELLGSLLRFI